MDQDSLKGMIAAAIGVVGAIVATVTGVHVDPAVAVGGATVITAWLYQHGKIAAAKAGAAAADKVATPAAAAAVFNSPAQLPPAPGPISIPPEQLEQLGLAIAKAIVTLTQGAPKP